MNNVYIKRIYLDNFKLFNDFTLDFSNGLNVFDGPNGYGKTSIFDAIEYLVTGDIKRVTTCEVLNGRYSYKKVFFAKDSKKDVIVKAEFTNGKESIVLAKKVDGQSEDISTVDNNPKKLREVTQTFLLPDFNFVKYDNKYLKNEEEIDAYLTKFFGGASQTLYSLLYYIQQEDRLDYFKKNEAGRVGSINTLFQIDDEKKKLAKIKQGKKKIADLAKSLDVKIKTLQKNTCAELENLPGAHIEYFKMLKRDVEWDKEEPIISKIESMNLIIQEIEKIRELFVNQKYYRIDLSNKRLQSFLHNESLHDYLKASIVLDAVGDNDEKYKYQKDCLSFLKQELEKSKRLEFLNIDYKKLGEYLNKKNECDEIILNVEEYNLIKNTSASVQQSINGLLDLRKKMDAYNKEAVGFSEGKCPYCGYDWLEEEKLLTNIKITTKDIETLLGTTGKQLKAIKEKIQMLFIDKISKEIEEKIIDLNKDNLLVLYCKLDEKRGMEHQTYVNDFLANNNLNILQLEEYTDEGLQNKIEENIKNIERALVSLPEQYHLKNQKYAFDNVMKVYFNSIDDLKNISTVDLEKKENYIKYQFVLQERKRQKKIDELIKKRDLLNKEVIKKMDNYMKDWKTSIGKYQGDIISKIEIPFYIYSARILQSYQGGQGILIRDKNTKDEVDAIRFTTPNEEHDVLYTMSSGQLSGILLSFSLALHKIFVNEGLNILLIDDPVQCMDDLNIVSFVELLKTEFPDIQLLISTHEKSFSNYITYKYEKYNLEYKPHNLKQLSSY